MRDLHPIKPQKPIRRLSILLIGFLFCACGFPSIGLSEDEKTTIPVWIDTDPACGQKKTDDVNDCWALYLAFRSPELDIRGISSVFGNTDGDTAYSVAKSVLKKLAALRGGDANLPRVYKGASHKIEPDVHMLTEATQALAETLRKEELTIIAIGPLTNLAMLIKEYPELTPNIRQIIAVAGNRESPEQKLFSLGDNRVLNSYDLSFRKDPDAFEIVLRSGVPLCLVPFEAAEKVTLTREDIAAVSSSGDAANWLVQISEGWITLWEKQLGMNGFYPFDCLAVSYAIMPSLFIDEKIPAKILKKKSLVVSTRDELAVSHDFTDAPQVTYCSGIGPEFKELLMARLTGNR